MISLSSTSKKSWGVRVRRALQLLGGVLECFYSASGVFARQFRPDSGNLSQTKARRDIGATVTVLDKDRGFHEP